MNFFFGHFNGKGKDKDKQKGKNNSNKLSETDNKQSDSDGSSRRRQHNPSSTWNTWTNSKVDNYQNVDIHNTGYVNNKASTTRGHSKHNVSSISRRIPHRLDDELATKHQQIQRQQDQLAKFSYNLHGDQDSGINMEDNTEQQNIPNKRNYVQTLQHYQCRRVGTNLQQVNVGISGKPELPHNTRPQQRHYASSDQGLDYVNDKYVNRTAIDRKHESVIDIASGNDSVTHFVQDSIVPGLNPLMDAYGTSHTKDSGISTASSRVNVARENSARRTEEHPYLDHQQLQSAIPDKENAGVIQVAALNDPQRADGFQGEEVLETVHNQTDAIEDSNRLRNNQIQPAPPDYPNPHRIHKPHRRHHVRKKKKVPTATLR